MPPSRSSALRRAIIVLCWLLWFIYHIIQQQYHDDHPFAQYIFQSDGGQKQQPIKARVIHNLPVHGLHADGTDVEYRCQVGELIFLPKRYKLWGGLNGTRQPLQHPLNRSSVLDFAVHISDMKLRILIVGNSLGEQLHAGLEEAMCFPINMTSNMCPSDRKWFSNQATCKTNFVENTDAQWIKEPRIVSTPSGGMLGVIKDNLNMIDTKSKWNLNNAAVTSLLKAFNSSDITGERNAIGNRKSNRLLDVLVYQFQSGHVDLNDFDEYYLEQAVIAASDLFHATAVILPTIAWMNNVDATRVDAWREVNDRIRNFARLYTPNSKSTVESVLVLDIAALSNAYIEANARILNIPEEETYTLRVNSRWESLVAQYCASLPFEDDPSGCLPGMVSLDGMHVCPETFHGRINAALVCLLDCKYTKRHADVTSLRTCSNECNAKYMTLDPVAFRSNEELKEEKV